ncbi:unnamed protein product [Hymenolepis diminuta]|uniref:SOCS box domain-containing protein n=1 Tax=Hymenolepis diminuta TaxID=6216 RepID=A0A0R3SMG5_HYMDI|nr:unnamed protein product [Hymenolepis diminuta]VUZ51635.1 unnamed protein product [Hymenolepis diminuta]
MVGILTPRMSENYTKSGVHSVIRKLGNNVKTRIFQENAQDIPFVSLNTPVIRRRVPWSLTNFLRKRSSGYVRCRGDFDETQSSNDIELPIRNYSCSERRSWPSVTNTQFTNAYGEIVLPLTGNLLKSCHSPVFTIKKIIDAMLDQRWRCVLELLSSIPSSYICLSPEPNISLINLFLYSCVFVNVSPSKRPYKHDAVVTKILDRLLVQGSTVEICKSGIQKTVLSSIFQNLCSASEIDFHSLFRRLLQSGLQVPVDLMTDGNLNYDTYYRILDCYARWKLQNPKLQNPPYSIESNFVLLLNIIYSGACMLPELNFPQNSPAAIIVSEIHRRFEILFKKNPHSLSTLARNKVRQIFPRKYFRELLSSGLSTNVPFFQHIQFSNKANELKDLVQWLNIVQSLPDNIRYNLMFLERRSLERELDFLLSVDLSDKLF